ncbi:MAG: sodium:proton antiporter [Chlamydiales bacterium]|nr:sodium:proton antiporter [Chlamydiales bacterium]
MPQRKIENVGGLLMIAAMLVALILSNTTDWYYDFVNTPRPVPWFFHEVNLSIKTWVKDGLMVLFFAYVGMELRHEFHDGFLKDKKQVVLPLLAAFGGMLVPALIYLSINYGIPENQNGFAVPCATDIAFAICLFNLIGSGLPRSIRIFLLAVAIFDDLGSILIIAAFYTDGFNVNWLLMSLPFLGLISYLSYRQTANTLLYAALGLLLCICFDEAGLHTTLSGFLIGFSLPFHDKSGKPYLADLMHKSHPVIQLAILPIFAFVSSGVPFVSETASDFFNPLFIGVALGLFLGKQIGITLFSYLTIRLKLAALPENSRLAHIYLVSIFAGIGFTMSLFIGILAFEDPAVQNIVKGGVMAGSFACVLLAFILMNGLRLMKSPLLIEQEGK